MLALPGALGICLVLLPVAVRGEDSVTTNAAPSSPIPPVVDLRPTFAEWGLPPRRQGDRPTCSVFTVAGALEFALARQRPPGERLSVEYLNWAANQTRRRVRDGGFFSELWTGYARHGICAEPEMPYQARFDPERTPAAEVRATAKEKLPLDLKLHWVKKWDVKTGLSTNEFSEIKETLRAGWPVCGGFRWPKQEQWKNDVLQMCPPEEVFDGHSVLLVGYRDEAESPGGGVLIFRNTSRGGRDGYMPYAYAHAYMNDAAWIQAQNAAKPAGEK